MGDVTDESSTFVLSFPTFSHANGEEAAERFEFVKSLLGLEAENLRNHPLRLMHDQAKADQSKSTVPWVASIQFVTLAFWGAQLETVKSWSGFKALADRVRREKKTWDAYIHEALSASLFQLAGCQGEFFVSDDTSIPDLKISYGGIEAVVECRQSRQLSELGKRNRKHWYPAVAKIAQRLEKEMPSAIIGFKAYRNADSADEEFLLQVADSFINSWKREADAGEFVASNHQHINARIPDGSFEMGMIVHNDGNVIFESLSDNFEVEGIGTSLGVEVPSFVAPVAFAGKGATGPVPKMDSFWYCAVSHMRPAVEVEEAVIKQLDIKASQLNRFRKSGSRDSHLPGIVWIDHPDLNNVGGEQLGQLKRRIQGKLNQNTTGHFEAVAAVVISQSRLLLSKSGQLTVQVRATVALNSNNAHKLGDSFPYISSKWWNDLAAQGVRTVTWMGREVNSLAVVRDDKPNNADLARGRTIDQGQPTGNFVDARVANQNLQKTLSKIRDLAAIGFNAPSIAPSALSLPTSRVQLDFGLSEPWDAEQANAEYKKWVLVNAFRDLMEALARMLDETYETLLAAQAIFGDGRSTEALWSEIEEDFKAKMLEFNRLTLPDRFDRLEKDFCLDINPDAVKDALSTNVAYNCLIQRGGVVSEPDLNSDSKLVISMRAVPVVYEDYLDRNEVTLPHVPQGSQIAGAERDTTKSFALGESISFDADDFSDLVWTVFKIGNEVERALTIHLHKYGANTIVSQSPSWELKLLFEDESSS